MSMINQLYTVYKYIYSIYILYIWVFPKIGVPQNGWLISWKTLLKWMIWGYHYFWKHPYIYTWGEIAVFLFRLFFTRKQMYI